MRAIERVEARDDYVPQADFGRAQYWEESLAELNIPAIESEGALRVMTSSNEVLREAFLRNYICYQVFNASINCSCAVRLRLTAVR